METKYEIMFGRIRRQGDNDKLDSICHAYNLFMTLYDTDVNGCWRNNEFFQEDVKEVTSKFINFLNTATENISIGWLRFIENTKPVVYGSYYSKPYCYYEDDMPFGPLGTFKKIQQLLNHQSIADYARAEFKKAGLPFGSVKISY